MLLRGLVIVAVVPLFHCLPLLHKPDTTLRAVSDDFTPRDLEAERQRPDAAVQRGVRATSCADISTARPAAVIGPVALRDPEIRREEDFAQNAKPDGVCVRRFMKDVFLDPTFLRTSPARGLSERCGVARGQKLQFGVTKTSGVRDDGRKWVCVYGSPKAGTEEEVSCGDAMQQAVCRCYYVDNEPVGKCQSADSAFEIDDYSTVVSGLPHGRQCSLNVPTDVQMLSQDTPCVNPNRLDQVVRGVPIPSARDFVSDCPEFSAPKAVLPLPDLGPAKYGRPRYRYTSDDLSHGAARDAVAGAPFIVFAWSGSRLRVPFSRRHRPEKEASPTWYLATLQPGGAFEPGGALGGTSLKPVTSLKVRVLYSRAPGAKAWRPQFLYMKKFPVAAIVELYVMLQLTAAGLARRFGTVTVPAGQLLYHATEEPGPTPPKARASELSVGWKTMGRDGSTWVVDELFRKYERPHAWKLVSPAPPKQWETPQRDNVGDPRTCEAPRTGYPRYCSETAGAAFLAPDWWYSTKFQAQKNNNPLTPYFGQGATRLIEYELSKDLKLLDFGWFGSYVSLQEKGGGDWADYRYSGSNVNKRLEWRELAFGVRRDCTKGNLCFTSTLMSIYRDKARPVCDWDKERAEGHNGMLDMGRHRQQNFDMTVLNVLLEEHDADGCGVHGYGGNDYYQGREVAVTRFVGPAEHPRRTCGPALDPQFPLTLVRVFALGKRTGWRRGAQICPVGSGPTTGYKAFPKLEVNPVRGLKTGSKFRQLDTGRHDSRCVPWDAVEFEKRKKDEEALQRVKEQNIEYEKMRKAKEHEAVRALEAQWSEV